MVIPELTSIKFYIYITSYTYNGVIVKSQEVNEMEF